MKKLYLLAILLILFFINKNILADSKTLLSEALQLNNSVDDNMTVEQKLQTYEKIQAIVENILSEHGASEEGIAIMSGQPIGNFNYSNIQEKYIKNLIGYFDTVCGVTPSFQCIAFVSLEQGVNSCISSKSVADLNIAHADIMNALNIFNSQDSKEQYKSLALNAYRNCYTVSKVEKNDIIKDYYNYKLVPALIKLNKPNQAKAIIQQTKNPYFKFSGVLALSEGGEKDLTKDFGSRMNKYIEEKIANFSYDKILSTQRLAIAMHNNVALTMDERRQYGTDGASINRVKSQPKKRGCTPFLQETVFNNSIELKDAKFISFKKTGEDRVVYHNNPKDAYIQPLLNSDSCDKRSFGTTHYIYSFFKLYDFIYEGNDRAQTFLNFAKANNHKKDIMLDYFLAFISENIEIYDALNEGMTPGGWVDVVTPVFTFKVKIVKGQICEGVEQLFKKFKNTENYPKAISFLINSPIVDRNKKYDCGDAELEMLLN